MPADLSGRLGRTLPTGRLPTALYLVIFLASSSACATLGSSDPGFDPSGTYAVTMASQGMVQEGTMTIRGMPGRYRGVLEAGVSAEIERVDVSANDMTVRAETDVGTLIVRLVRDGDFFSGNWVLGERRGTFTCERVSNDG